MKIVYLYLLCALLLTPSTLLKAQNCSQGLTIINELWQNFDPVDLVNNMDDINFQVTQLKSEVATFAKYSLKKDAPRLLPVGNGKAKKINLRHGKKRTFLTTPIKQETLKVKIARLETNSSVTVTICYHTLKGETGNIEKLNFPAGGDGTLIIDIPEVKGKIISITILNNSVSKINYTIVAA